MKRLIIWLLFLYCITSVFVFLFSEKIIFKSNPPTYDSTTSGISFIETYDGEQLAIRSWNIAGSDKMVLYFHGNNEDLGELDFIAWYLNGLGLSVMAMDYRGYGLSSGDATEENVYLDANRLLKEANKIGYRNEKIILWGRSLGSGPVLDLAVKEEDLFAGMVLTSPFKSILTILTQYPILVFDRFDNISKLENVVEPLLLIHGINDELIPFEHSKELKKARPDKTSLKLIDGAGHNDLWLNNFETIQEEVGLFFQEIK